MHFACIKSTWYLPSMSRILYSIQLEYLAFRSCVLCVYAHCNQAWLIIKFVLLLAKQVFSSLDSFIPLLFYTHTLALALTLPHSHSTKFYYLFRELGVSILNSILFKYPWFNEWVPTFFLVECVCVCFFSGFSFTNCFCLWHETSSGFNLVFSLAFIPQCFFIRPSLVLH